MPEKQKIIAVTFSQTKKHIIPLISPGIKVTERIIRTPMQIDIFLV